MSVGVGRWRDLEAGPDPRLHTDSVECVTGADGVAETVLVGVVHDHPASVARVRRVLAALAPDVLALELPEHSVGLFEAFADVPAAPPPGGEMSAAIRASPESRLLGIDAPSRAFGSALWAAVRRGELDRSAVGELARQTARLTSHAAACWAAAGARRLSVPFPDVTPRVEYDCSHEDPPSVQADHEARHVRRSQGFLAAVDEPAGRERFGELREVAMATRLRGLESTQSVVAVVGRDHLTAIADRLRTPEQPTTRWAGDADESRRH